ncbi:TPA: helix-turn-helix transcriptional regulator [Staphylococcus aureus]|nr:helix-turn-helix transcriptional regulator [Staphylococcus aureus]HDG8586584.1 helix-turn-helix transcriptional regulator [Staphylococcus aureus]
MAEEQLEEVFEQCPVVSIQKLIHVKWSMVVFSFISKGTIRFGELSRKVPMISQANLTKELRLLESYQLIHRKVYAEVPPKVEYSLTPLGEKFIPVLQALETFAYEYEDAMKHS